MNNEPMVLTEVWDADFRLSVDLKYTDGKPDSYPRVARIMNGIDTNRLHEEYQMAMESLDQEPIIPIMAYKHKDWVQAPDKYLRYFMCHRRGKDIPVTSWMPYKNCIGDYTKDILSRFKSHLYEPRYVRVRPGHSVAPHIDHEDCGRCGFRVFIPITQNEDCTTTIDQVQFKLESGYAWFTNVGKVHSASNLGETERVCILLDLLSDVDIYEAMRQCN